MRKPRIAVVILGMVLALTTLLSSVGTASAWPWSTKTKVRIDVSIPGAACYVQAGFCKITEAKLTANGKTFIGKPGLMWLSHNEVTFYDVPVNTTATITVNAKYSFINPISVRGQVQRWIWKPSTIEDIEVTGMSLRR